MFELHVALAGGTVLVMGTAVFTVLALKGKRWWLKVHRRLGLTAGILGIMTVAMAWLMVNSWQGRHLGSLHSYLGLAAALSAVGAVTLGHLQFRPLRARQALRLAHRAGGYFTVFTMVLAALLGLVHAGFIF